MNTERVRRATLQRVSFSLLIALIATPSNAETLREALLSAYKKSPQLNAERSNLRATDEQVPQALSGYRPLVTFSADTSVQKQNVNPDVRSTTSRDGRSYPSGYAVSLNQQIFRGMRTRNAVNAAEANVLAGRETLRSTEQTVLLSSVTAFMNVVRDAAIVQLRENNVRVLSRDLRATQDRFSVGEVTRTDVAQSRARRAQAVSDLESARANLKSSRANYEQIMGHPPRNLREPSPPYRLLPKTLQEARRRAERDSPSVVFATYNEQAAHYTVKEIRGELLPTLSVDAGYSNRYTGGGDFATSKTETGIVTGTLSVPLYQRGSVSSRVRQAKHLHVRTMQLVEKARNEAREAAISSWAQLNASRAQLRSASSRVEANDIALSGVREEEKVGQRTLLDVLDAEQELLNSKVSLVSNRRDLVVNAYTLLSTIGRLTAGDLALTSQIHDAKENSNKVRRKWHGLSITHSNGHREYIEVEDKSAKD